MLPPASTCEKSPTGAHHRVIKVFLGVEEQTCKYCGDSKEQRASYEYQDAQAYSHQAWQEKGTPPPPTGFHWGM